MKARISVAKEIEDLPITIQFTLRLREWRELRTRISEDWPGWAFSALVRDSIDAVISANNQVIDGKEIEVMDARTEKALRESIVKWETYTKEMPALRPDYRTCPLCHLFNNDEITSAECEGCPVNSAGHNECVGTPYYDAFRAYTIEDSDAFREGAQREVDFLKSLLPQEPL